MYRALTAEQSRIAEERAIASGRTTLLELMCAAGERLAAQIALAVPHGRVAVLCGPGNNGGDGWVAAQVLHASGRDVFVHSMIDPARLPAPANEAARHATTAGVAWDVMAESPSASVFDGATVIVDALLGTGSAPPLRGVLPAWCRSANASGAFIVCADMPTGVDADTGRVDPDGIIGNRTVAFASLKRGHVIYPGADRAGRVVVVDIGLSPEEMVFPGAPEVWSDREYADLLPVPAADAHKNARGRVLVIAGSGRFPGAAVLAARGAMRAGAGYVTLAVPEPIVAIAQGHLLASPVVGLPASRSKAFSSVALNRAIDLAHDHDAVVLGPGITLADGAVTLTREIMKRYSGPLVVDADALNALVDASELIASRNGPTVLTPHPGELARLLDVECADVQADRVSSSATLSSESCAVVLKGAGTVVSGEGRCVVTTSGSVALATAGTGDVLAGMIGALLATGLSPLHAGSLAAHLHGRAGENAALERTPMCVTAEDVPECIPAAVRELLGNRQVPLRHRIIEEDNGDG